MLVRFYMGKSKYPLSIVFEFFLGYKNIKLFLGMLFLFPLQAVHIPGDDDV